MALFLVAVAGCWNLTGTIICTRTAAFSRGHAIIDVQPGMWHYCSFPLPSLTRSATQLWSVALARGGGATGAEVDTPRVPARKPGMTGWGLAVRVTK